MSPHRIRVRRLIPAVALACSAVVAVAPGSASATGAVHHASTKAAHSSHGRHGNVVRVHLQVRAYDDSLLSRVNTARADNSRRAYTMITKLHRLARSWAAHLASTGVLEHNPALVADISRLCPNWTNLGENVGVEGGSSANQMFSAYMHSPPHRANILDRSYTVVGIATVTSISDGIKTQWNVMDFANHCH